MSIYVVGKTYLFIRLESTIIAENIKEKYILSTPSNVIADKIGIIDPWHFSATGVIGKNIIKNISFIELTCTEIVNYKDNRNSKKINKGYLFIDSNDRIYSVQYPTSCHTRLNNYEDYITHIYKEDLTDDKLKDPEINKIINNEYVLFSKLINDTYDKICEFSKKEDVISKYHYRDPEDYEKILSSIEINFNDFTRRFFFFLLSIIPNNWKLSFCKENIYEFEENVEPSYINNIIFEKK